MKTYLDVTGSGTASAPSDVVLLDLRVQCEGADVSGALQDASGRMARVQEAVRAHGVAPADLRTTGSGVHQRWADKGDRIVGYTAFQTLQVRVRDVAAVGAVVRSVASAAGDALGIDAITLAIGDPGPVARAAREAAFADARAKAEQYAALAGRSLGPVLRLSDVPVAAVGPAPRMARMVAASAELSVEPGEQTVAVQLTVRWAWADRLD